MKSLIYVTDFIAVLIAAVLIVASVQGKGTLNAFDPSFAFPF